MKYLKHSSIFLSTFLAISLAGSLFIPFFTRAQVGQTQIEINVDMIPVIPGANEVVTVNLTSYSTNIDAATVTWIVNGKVIKKGVGEKSFQFTTGDLNKETIFEVDTFTIEGKNIKNVYKIHPAEVDLVWQSDSFTPPFYKGKPLFSHQNRITFIAFPHITDPSGRELDPKTLIYKWEKNGSPDLDASGYSKNTYSFVGSLISRPLDVSVEVTDPNSNAIGIARINATPVEPSLVFYEKNPLYGFQFQNALLGTVELKKSKEMAVIGVPFYAGTLNPVSPDLLYNWSVNGASIKNLSNQNVEVFRKKDGATGEVKISLSIENSQKILQYVNGYFNLKFGDENTPGTQAGFTNTSQ